MNDYWNDPPEYDEPPECCGDIMEQLEDGTLVCEHCGKRYEPAQDIELVDECSANGICFIDAEEYAQAQQPFCPHGNAWGSCDACDYASDLAYDAERERKH